MSNFDFSGKIVLITGGSRGIGKATAIAFARAGAHVIINYRQNISAAQETLQSLPGEHHSMMQADIANPDSVKNMIEQVIQQYQRLDILVNNAGVFARHALTEVDYQGWIKEWNRTIAINLLGAANTMYCAAQQMIKQGEGKIINVSSRGAYRGEPFHPAYGASKAGMNSLGQSLAQALAPHGITVATVAPGFVATDMADSVMVGEIGEAIRQQSPLGRVAQPEEIAHAILYLASNLAEYATGTVLDINGASYLH